jgi:drug/metabolite transporter (DMT)-like permease
MMAILLMLLAGIFVSCSNLFMRKSIDGGGTTKGFLVFQMTTALGVALLLYPIRTGNYAMNLPVSLMGIVAGGILAGLLFFLGRALENGPPGVTFSILNGATVIPAILMASLFGSSLGFPYTPWHAIGSLVVLGGLFWAGKSGQESTNRRAWILFACAMFVCHVLLLSLFQWRALILHLPHPEELTSLVSGFEIQSQWFTPWMFFTSALIQIAIFLVHEKRSPTRLEALYGLLGGVANGICTYLIIAATEVATPLENAVIYPILSVMTIILSNLWGQKLYQERVNWRACQICALGLLIGTIDWKAVSAALGL